MSDPKGYYEVLGVKPNSSFEEIKNAYKRLQIQLHPDNGSKIIQARKIKDEAERKKAIEEIYALGKKVNEAKEVLLDKDKKEEYDNPNAGSFSFFDLFNTNRKRKVKDTVYEFSITMEQVFNGLKKKFKIKRRVLCTGCDGKGADNIEACKNCGGQGIIARSRRNASGGVSYIQQVCNVCRGEKVIIQGPICSSCSGKSYMNVSETVEVVVNPGIKSGEEILFEGLGDELEGCVSGDLKFTVTVEDGVYKRVDDHIIAPVKIDLYTALAGGTVSFKHLDQKVYVIKIDRVKSFNECICVKNLGFGQRGNLYLQPEYEVPNIDPGKLKQIFNVPEKSVNGELMNGVHCKAPEAEEEQVEDQFSGASTFRSFFQYF